MERQFSNGFTNDILKVVLNMDFYYFNCGEKKRDNVRLDS